MEDFNVLKVLGRGSFGKVCLVEYLQTKTIYAMKSLKKDVLIDQDQIENTLLEKKILILNYDLIIVNNPTNLITTKNLLNNLLTNFK